MNTVEINSLGNNLSRPISEGVHKPDGAQFALLLSLYQEGLSVPAAGIATNQPEALRTNNPESLSVSLASAFQAGRSGEFNLLRSLLGEISLPTAVVDDRLRSSESVNTADPDRMLTEIQQGKAFGR